MAGIENENKHKTQSYILTYTTGLVTKVIVRHDFCHQTCCIHAPRRAFSRLE